MRIAIVEDELPARQQLISLLRKIRNDVQVVNVSDSIREAVAFLETRPAIDLIFMDIQLNDGLSFEIFKRVTVHCPVIFTTAYDEYMLRAFHENGIDYLLKPLKKTDLENAFEKLRRLKDHFSSDMSDLLALVRGGRVERKHRFVAKKGVSFKSVPVSEVCYFFSEHKVTFLVTADGEKLIVDKPLAELEADLDTESFFRINRKYIAAISAVESYRSFEKGKLMVKLVPEPKEEVIVSQEKAAHFRNWMDR